LFTIIGICRNCRRGSRLLCQATEWNCMTLYYLFLTSAVQGITEFIPVSSSGHLVLLPGLTGMPDQGLQLDVAAHVGTLGAVILYFRRDVFRVMKGVPGLARGRIRSEDEKLAMHLALATVPVVAFGALLTVFGLDDAMRSIEVVGWATLAFGIVLYWADATERNDRSADGWTARDAIVMGLWQALALIPGASRSGVVISGARRLGFERKDAARLAMLMSIPTIIAAGALTGAEAAGEADAAFLVNGAIVAAVSFACALMALKLMMRFLEGYTYKPYVYYRIVLGALLILAAPEIRSATG